MGRACFFVEFLMVAGRLIVSGSAGVGIASPTLTKTQPWQEGHVMATDQPTAAPSSDQQKPIPTEKETSRRKALAERNRKHGMARSPEYLSWVAMIQRCHNPKATGYHNYGCRGIVVCDRWRKSFAAFFEDMGERPSPAHTLDRVENGGNYEPGNCRWATPSQQKRNSRVAVLLTYQGQTKPIIEWAEVTGKSRFLIRKRIAAGWSVHDALTRDSHRGVSCK